MPDVVLITGVSRYLGGAFARALSQVEGGPTRIIGVDVIPPPHPIGRAEFLRADIRSPMIGKIIEASAVDTVVHMGVIATPIASGGRATQKEINVIGTMQLLAACQKAASVQRLVVKSTAGVYGSSHRDPAMFTEDMGPKRVPRSGYAKDVYEIEAYVRGFQRRRPDVRVTMLRCANVIGPHVRSPLTSYFRLPVIPTVLGFDPRLQFLHEKDLWSVLTLAALGDSSGTFNVAGDGVMTLGQAVRRSGRPTVALPSPAVGGVGSLLKRARLADFSPEQVSLLTYGRGVDTRRMREVLGFRPSFTTEAAFADFADSLPATLNPGRSVVDLIGGGRS